MTPKDMTNPANKGAVLLVVLSVILTVVALANIILMLVTSQTRLTQHQIGRTQAFYTAHGAMNYAMEMLRTGAWAIPGAGATLVRVLCSQAGGAGCTEPINSGFPFDVVITVYSLGADPPGPAGAIANVAPIDISVIYTTSQ